MSIEPHEIEGESPDVPHLLWLVSHDEGAAIMPGHYVCIVTNAKLGTAGIDHQSPESGSAIPLILKSVSKTKLSFKCACGQKACTREVTFKAAWKGIHPVKYK